VTVFLSCLGLSRTDWDCLGGTLSLSLVLARESARFAHWPLTELATCIISRVVRSPNEPPATRVRTLRVGRALGACAHSRAGPHCTGGLQTVCGPRARPARPCHSRHIVLLRRNPNKLGLLLRSAQARLATPPLWPPPQPQTPAPTAQWSAGRPAPKPIVNGMSARLKYEKIHTLPLEQCRRCRRPSVHLAGWAFAAGGKGKSS